MPIDLATLAAPAHTALVLQEVQNGVVGSPSALPALAKAAAATGLISNCARLAAAARVARITVVHCIAETRDDGRGANRNARLFAGVRKAAVRLSPGSAAVQVPDEIGVAPEDVVLARYQGLGPMAGTQLDPMLRNLGVTTIVGAGVSLNVGMANFAFDAVNLGYQMVMPRDAVAGVPADYAAAVLDNSLALVATLTSTAELLRAWAAR
ncbi:MAG: isochorismatase family protein [Actinomycetota bacterium]